MSEIENEIELHLLESARRFAAAQDEVNELLESLMKVEDRATDLRTSLDEIRNVKSAITDSIRQIQDLLDFSAKTFAEMAVLTHVIRESNFDNLNSRADETLTRTAAIESGLSELAVQSTQVARGLKNLLILNTLLIFSVLGVLLSK